MARIIWRPVEDLAPSRAQDGVALLPCGTSLTLSIRPARSRRGSYRDSHGKLLILSIDGSTHLWRPSIRDCKSGAEQIIRKIESKAILL